MYVGLYGSGLFNFWSYVNLLTLFAYLLGFDVPTSFSIFIENVFYYSCNYIHVYNSDNLKRNNSAQIMKLSLLLNVCYRKQTKCDNRSLMISLSEYLISWMLIMLIPNRVSMYFSV